MSTPPTDDTLNPSLRSFVESANADGTDFPIQNLPFGRYRLGDGPPTIGVAIGDRVLDVDMLFHAGWFGQDDRAERLHRAVHTSALNYLLADEERPLAWLRREVQRFLLDGPAGGQPVRRLRDKALHPMQEVRPLLPCVIPNYTDFYASVHHATNVGSMFRPDNPLLPNYKHIPIGYHGRASSVVPSGSVVVRPSGQTRPDDKAPPVFGPCKRLDYELEVGCVIGRPNALGTPIPIDRAADHIAGLVLVNDWSARDMQAWEYQPLGPFLAKNFATTVSPWLVTAEALAPFRCPGPARAEGDPAPLDYLALRPDAAAVAGYDITLEVAIRSRAMREKGLAPHRVSSGNLRDMFWTFPQMIAHHASGGCNLQAGDLLASGTVSGPAPDSRGCLLELTWAGNGPDGKPLPRRPVQLPSGEQRTFLEDGDEVIITGKCRRDGYRPIGFGWCAGVVEGRTSAS
ncbi:MAG: fumarylacetoacetase [Phycisphaeraceae bacterium]|nr:fumarylacetoacetase [Phycisphaeraceae bacterium]